MDKITFFHCADLHLDTPFTSLASKAGLPSLRRKDIFTGFAKLIDNAKSEKPNFLFIAGDLFEHEYTGLKTVSAVNGLFNSIPETKIIMISGNHDPEAANSFYRTYQWGGNVYFIGDETDSLFFREYNTEIFGLGWGPGFGQSAKLETIDTDGRRINILLFHGDIDLQIGARDYNSISSDMLKPMGFDYVAAGHNHKKKEGEGHGIFFNPGSLSPLGFDEPGLHGYYKGNITKGILPEVEFVEISNTEYKTLEIDICDCESNIKVLNLVKPLLNSENTLYKIILKGNKQLDYSPDISVIEKALVDMVLFVKIRDTSSVSMTFEELSLVKGLKGTFSRYLLEQLDSSDEEEEKAILEKALYYGIEAIDSGKIERAGGEDL